MRLTRDHVVAVALDLLDEVGLEHLTMRRLADALDVRNGATYWHFRSKQALLEAMADALLTGLPADLPAGQPWDELAADVARRLRRALLSRRDGARLFSGSFFPLPNALAYGETMVGLLVGAGLDHRSATWATDTLTYYVVAHVTEEQLAAALPDSGKDARNRLDAALDPTEHPHLLAARDDLAAPHPNAHFDYGLSLVLAGIRGELTG
ncbi:TetR/AcrR family transcriptional regulator C-terminal domain-containing protein [Pseudonocardia alaniniphila]|uniref:TetR/AcrR family transcriptional regulator C-terminal domain-containing protein n=1 Tax=Pseudonocardia alaniniphila TaxID=75291 RepID=A0ABS9TGS3_9PSEU|nr:TetR/AcrR family transcriptional regulator C-terminal domain-containing protein [Pseudonocardia alaniniphila]MCH6167481.1 TetR/AcrR family transcriptional regulator C-terminal domain-containing protein [Pseudonocardia alaniniphila]